MDENMDGSLLLSCVFSFCSKPSALRPVKMEEPARLQMCAVVRVGGLDGYVDKVLTAFHNYHSWQALVLLLDYFASCIVHV